MATDWLTLSSLISSWLSLIVSILALCFGWQSDQTARGLLEKISKDHRREAARVDQLIEALTKVTQTLAERGR